LQFASLAESAQMAVIIVVLSIAGALWGVLFALRGSVLAGCFGYIVAAACFGHQFASFDLGPIPLTIDRLVLVGLAAAYVVQRRLCRIESVPWGRTEWLAVAFFCVLAVSTISHDWNVGAAGEVSPVWRLIGGYAIPIALYMLARQAMRTDLQVRRLHISLALFGLYLAFTGIFEATGQWWLVFPKFIADPNLGVHFGRARGPMVQSVTYGHYVAVCLLAAVVGALSAPRGVKLLIGLLVPVFAAAIYASYTRSVWIGTALALALALGVMLDRRFRPVVLGVIAAAGLVAAIANFDSLLGFRREGSAADTRSSADVRAAFAYVSWQMFLDRPLVGCGFGQFPQAKLPYLADRSTALNLEAMRGLVHHNTFLSVLTETGLVGLALYVAWMAAMAKTAWRLSRRRDRPHARCHGIFTLAALVVYLVQAVFHELSYTPLDTALLCLLTGAATGLTGTRSDENRASSRGAERRAAELAVQAG
jgi:O-antigen ligase